MLKLEYLPRGIPYIHLHMTLWDYILDENKMLFQVLVFATIYFSLDVIDSSTCKIKRDPNVKENSNWEAPSLFLIPPCEPWGGRCWTGGDPYWPPPPAYQCKN